MAGVVVVDNGRMVDAGVERIAQVIKDYDKNLELAWIPPENRDKDDKKFPFAVIHNNPRTGKREVVFRLRENEIDHRVIARIWNNDNQKQNVLDRIESEERARKAVELLEQMDRDAEAQELAAWMIKARHGATTPGGNRLT